MRIGIGALLVHGERFGGAETYARQLLRCLPEVDQQNEYLVFVPQGSDLQLDAPNFQIVKCPAPVANPFRRVAWEHLWFAKTLQRYAPDVTHFLGSTAPYGYSRRSVVTIHDSLRIQRPDLTPLLLGKYYDLNQKHIVRTGKHVIFCSRTAAHFLQPSLGISEAQYTVIHLGVDEIFFRREEDPPVTKHHLLWAGRMNPHKNLEVLFDAYRILQERGLKLPLFRLIGATPADRARLEPALRARGVESLFSLEPPLPHDQWRQSFPQLVKESKIFCFPSKYESFGLPVLEAMAAGTAVVCSDLPCFAELFADAVISCPTDSAERFANAIEQLLSDDALRARYEERGSQVVLPFTWRRCAEQTVEVYRKLAS